MLTALPSQKDNVLGQRRCSHLRLSCQVPSRPAPGCSTQPPNSHTLQGMQCSRWRDAASRPARRPFVPALCVSCPIASTKQRICMRLGRGREAGNPTRAPNTHKGTHTNTPPHPHSSKAKAPARPAGPRPPTEHRHLAARLEAAYERVRVQQAEAQRRHARVDGGVQAARQQRGQQVRLLQEPLDGQRAVWGWGWGCRQGRQGVGVGSAARGLGLGVPPGPAGPAGGAGRGVGERGAGRGAGRGEGMQLCT